MNPRTEQLLQFIRLTSTTLPDDVIQALDSADAKAIPGSPEKECLATIRENIRLAKQNCRPCCQDTGTLLFYITSPRCYDRTAFEEDAREAVALATEEGILRQNCVETLSGHNTGNNLGEGSPVFHWEESDSATRLSVTLLLKGGGSENMGAQYSLPDTTLQAGRDLDGVRKCILDAVWKAQGKGCAPGILGVCIGGDRATSYETSKKMLLRKIGERSTTPALAELERTVLREANSLCIGAMGLGGNTTLLDLFIGERCRLPASYFVSISYLCWCCRRQTIQLPL